MEKTKVVVILDCGMPRVIVSDTEAVDVEILDFDLIEAEGTEEELEDARKRLDYYDSILHDVW